MVFENPLVELMKDVRCYAAEDVAMGEVLPERRHD